MGTLIGGGYDASFLDDVLLKEGPLGSIEEYLDDAPPHTFPIERWDRANNVLCVRSGEWLAYYKYGWPLALYHNGAFACGLRVGAHEIRIDHEAPDSIWARVGARVVMERGDYPRVEVSGTIKLSHTPKRTPLENVFSLGNGYSLATSRRCQPIEYGIVCPENTWIMVGPSGEEARIHRRVLCVKIYDGPHPYQARGTDIRLADPVPVSSRSEYVIYAYDEKGIEGLYREIYEGVAPQKKALLISGEDLLRRARETEGDLRMVEGQLVGEGRAVYELPIKATKLLDVWHRGGETEIKINPDGTGWTIPEGYDGLAVHTLELEASIKSSLSAIRVEWEAIRDWEPVGRPRIDIIRPDEHPEDEQKNRNKVRITGMTTEGLGQTVDLYTGIYTASADVRCLEGKALIDVGGVEVVSWNPLDKTVRASGDFSVNAGRYEAIITGVGEPFSMEVDRFQIADAGQRSYLEEDIRFEVETEGQSIDASESVNNPEVPVAVRESERFRLRVRTPKDLGWMRERIAINHARIKLYHTGMPHIVRTVRWQGEGRSRIYYPENVIYPPSPMEYIPAQGTGRASWEVRSPEDEGDVRLTMDGSGVSFRRGELYRGFSLVNGDWEARVNEEGCEVLFLGEVVGRIAGRMLPARIVHYDREDIEMDCSGGTLQMRRGMGPRMEGFEVLGSSVPYIWRDGVIAFGEDDDAARSNLPHYRVTSGS